MTENDVQVPTSTLFEMLANDHRRRLLLALLEHNPQQETLTPQGVSLDGDELERVQIQMHHMHLPKLEDASLIRWDRDVQQVLKGPTFDHIRPLLELLYEKSDTLLEDGSTKKEDL